jgi:hypothetical protein
VGWGIEASEQLVHHDQQFHLPGLVDEAFLCLLLELLHLVHRRLFRFIEVRRQHLSIDLIASQLLSQTLAALLALDVRGRRPIGSDDGTLTGQISLLEHLEKAAGGVDAAGNKHGIAVTALEPVTRLHVDQNVVDDLRQPVAGREYLLHRAPALLELGLGQVRQATCFEFEPLIHLHLRGDALVDIACLVAQIKHHAVAHCLVVFIGVDIGTEGLDGAALVAFEQRRAREAY